MTEAALCNRNEIGQEHLQFIAKTPFTVKTATKAMPSVLAP